MSKPVAKNNMTLPPVSQDFHDILENSPIGIFSSSPEGKYIYVNPAMARILGYATTEELIDSVTDIASQVYFNPADREEFKLLLETHGEVVNNECRLLRKDGTMFWASRNARAVRDEQGNILYYQGFTTDITKRRLAEEKARQSEKYYQAVFETSGAAQVIVEEDTTISLANSRFAELSGYSREEIEEKKPWTEFVHPDDLERMKELHFMRRRDPESAPQKYEFRVVDRYGQVRNIFLNIDLIPGTNQSIASLIDVTERNKSEDKLKAAFAKLQTITDSAQDAVLMMNPEGNISFWNPAAERILGYNSDEAIGKNLHMLLAPKRYHTSYIEAFPRFSKTGQGNAVDKIIELESLRKDGLEIQVELSLSALELSDGWHAVGFLRDITQRKQAEEELRKSEEKYRQLFESSPISLWEQDFSEVKKHLDDIINTEQPDDLKVFFMARPELVKKLAGMVKVLNVNEATLKLYNAGSKEVFLSGIRKVFSEESYESFIDGLLIIARGGTRIFAEKKHLTLDGKPLDIQLHWSVAPGYEENYSRVLVCIIDITERKKIEKQLKFLSFHDQLTKLYNRNCFEYEMQRLSKSREYPITIICMDVDGLKMINDTLGHDQGDKILKQCADLLQDTFRKSDIVARTGGDEFAALLPKTDKQAGQKIVRRIRTVIDDYNQQAQANQIPLSISIGMSVADNADNDLSLIFKEADDLMYRDKLSKDVTHRSRIMRSLLAALEERDFMSHESAQRMENLCRLVGKKIDLSEKQLSDLVLLVHLHDIGNAGIPDHVLFKQGPLTEEEWRLIYQHPEKGYRIVKASIDLAEIGDLILKHHEHWDGEGYPLGLEGNEIPIECRIFSIIDAYDAMISQRRYRESLAHEDAIAELKRRSGTQFDPDLVEKFIEIIQQ